MSYPLGSNRKGKFSSFKKHKDEDDVEHDDNPFQYENKQIEELLWEKDQ
jgi:hypothetical protein